MKLEVLVLGVVVTAASALLTAAVRRLAFSANLLDVPNQRSSHVVPVPRGGGIAIALTTIGSLFILVSRDLVPADLAVALSGAGASVAVAGFIDDRRGLRPAIRLLVHFAAATWVLGWLGGMPDFQVGNRTLDLGILGDLLALLGLVWVINLYNFMDGIDGLAGSEAVFIALGSIVVAVLTGSASVVAPTAMVLAAGCTGFLCLNWPPARIFMGDVGSGFIGLSIAVLALASTREDPAALLVWLILGGAFFVDATITLCIRLLRGQKVYEAHRSHAYQRLARRWQSHRRVTHVFLITNLCWLLPWATIASRFPGWAGCCVLAAFLPPVACALWLAAGLPDEP